MKREARTLVVPVRKDFLIIKDLIYFINDHLWGNYVQGRLFLLICTSILLGNLLLCQKFFLL